MTYEEGSVNFATKGFIGLGVAGILSVIMVAAVYQRSYAKSLEPDNQNVLGNEKPETYVEINGIKYYSRIDGEDISDLVKK
ncbi:MAG: hypothetical protein Q8R47_01975 [Nanoarchaeota archaeon]|nr:hypothetical protein [Nanoarchaeota archaeon]